MTAAKLQAKVDLLEESLAKAWELLDVDVLMLRVELARAREEGAQLLASRYKLRNELSVAERRIDDAREALTAGDAEGALRLLGGPLEST